MKRGTIIFIVAAAVCVIAACALILTGVIPFPWLKKETAQKQPILYVAYTDSCMLVDDQDVVIESTPEIPEGIPRVSGISFSSIIVGKKLVPVEEAAYQYARKIVEALSRNNLFANEVYISSDLRATIYVNNVKILLGTDDKTEEKLKELRDFYEDLKDLSGTLDMQELSQNNIGYSLKPY